MIHGVFPKRAGVYIRVLARSPVYSPRAAQDGEKQQQRAGRARESFCRRRCGCAETLKPFYIPRPR